MHACGHHADRSADDAQYLCALCVKTLLTASAFLRTRDSDYTRGLLARHGNERLLTLRPEFAIQTVQEFARAHPRMWEVVTASPQWSPGDAGSRLTPDVREALDPVGRELLLAAVCVALVLRIPAEDIEKILLAANVVLSAEAPRRPRR